jgi:hypothetical protein
MACGPHVSTWMPRFVDWAETRHEELKDAGNDKMSTLSAVCDDM